MNTFKYLSIVALAAVSVTGFAQSKKYTVGGGSPAQQIAQVESQTELETFTGRTSKVTGVINFDAKKKTGSGKISVDVASIDTGIQARNEHMAGAQWLDAGKHPTLTFEVVKVKSLGNDNYKVTGNFTLRGVTKSVTSTTTVKLRPASDATKKAGFKGDVLQVKASFPVNLSYYGIKISGPATGKVADKVTVTVTLYAQSGS